MNYIDYWWTKLRLRAAGYVVRWNKKQVLLHIQNSRRAAMLLDKPYQRFIRASVKREELAVHLKYLSGRTRQFPLLGMRFDAGEVAVSSAADTIPLYDRAVAMAHHHNGDWGNVPAEEWRENNRNLQNGCGVVCSKYLSGSQRLFRIETDLATSKTNIQWEREAA